MSSQVSSTRKGSPNYTQIEILAILAGGLEIYELGAANKYSKLCEAMRSKYVAHVTALANGSEMEDHSKIPWPEWPHGEVSVRSALSRADDTNSPKLWKRLKNTLMVSRKIEATFAKLFPDGGPTSGKQLEDTIAKLLQELWKEKQSAKKKTIVLDNSDDSSSSSSSSSSTADTQDMPPSWKGPVEFLAWKKFGALGQRNPYITSEMRNGPSNKPLPYERRRGVKTSSNGSNEKSPASNTTGDGIAFPVNPTPKSRKQIRTSENLKSHDKTLADLTNQLRRRNKHMSKFARYDRAVKDRHRRIREAKLRHALFPSPENAQKLKEALDLAVPDIPVDTSSSSAGDE